MTTLTITIPNSNPAIMQALEGWCKMGEIIIENNDATCITKPDEDKFERIPGLPYTREERIAAIQRAEEDFNAGLCISHEDMRAKHPRI